MKKAVGMCILLVALLVLCFGSAAADSSGTCGENLSWSLNSTTGVLTISGSGAMYDYASVYGTGKTSAPWGSGITRVTIGSGVTTIGTCAFSGCTGLTGITIPGSVASIGNSAFYGCTALSGVSLPYGVTTINASSFQGCTNLSTISLPATLTSIGNSAFKGCTLLSAVSFPAAITTIDRSAFSDCTSLTRISIPSNVTTVSGYVFSGCSSLSAVTIPNGVTSIEDCAFKDCPSLTNITIPASVTSISYQAFQNCTGLTGISIPASVTSIGNNLFQGCTNLDLFVYQGRTISLGGMASSGVSGSAQWILGNNQVLILFGFGRTADYSSSSSAPWKSGSVYPKNVIVFPGVTGIGKNAFCSCTAMESIELPDTLVSIGAYAFSCSKLSAITIPEGVTSIGEYAFAYCNNLTGIDLPGTVSSIGAQAFSNCVSLTDLFIPEGVSSLGTRVFDGCSNLDELTVASENQYFSVEDGVLYNKDKTALLWCSLTKDSITIPETVTSIGEWAFSNCTSLISADIPGSVAQIGNYAFYGCRGLEICTLHPGLETIGGYAFGYCAALTDINIPDTVSTIDYGAFYYCSGLQSIAIPESVTVLSTQAFGNCTGLTSVSLPDTLTIINYYAFVNCSGLTGVAIPDSVVSIGDYAFAGCSGLTGVTIPDSVVSIGEYAFQNCSGLRSITIPGSAANIGQYAFSGCGALTDAVILSRTAAFGTNVFGNNNSSLVLTVLSNSTALAYAESNNILYALYISEEDSGLEYYESKDQLHIIGYSGEETQISIPSSIDGKTVVSIANGAFLGCSGLVEITIPDTIVSIGDYAFKNCTSLAGIMIPGSVEEFKGSTFDGCSSLASITYQGKTVTLNGVDSTGTSDSIQWILGMNKTLMMFGKGRTYNYTSSYSSREWYSKGATSAILFNGITGIGSYTFAECTTLESVTIPSSVVSIGNNAFYNCSAKKYAELDSETARALSRSGYSFRIEGTQFNLIYSFSDNEPSGLILSQADKSITSADVPDGVTSISSYAFYGCTGLTSITLPDRLTQIEYYAFYNCSGLKTVSFPDSVEYIGSYAFYGCDAVFYANDDSASAIALCKAGYSFHDPEMQFSIRYLFDSSNEITGAVLTKADQDLTAILIPDYITGINSAAFSQCTELPAIEISENHPSFSVLDGVLYSKDMTTLIACPAGFEGDLSIPDTTADIAAGAFSNCARLSGVTLPEGISSIKSKTFSGCENLQSVTIPASVTQLEGDLFSGCNSLETIVMNGSMPSISAATFSGCSGVSAIICANGEIHPSQSTLYGICGASALYSVENDTLKIVGNGSMHGYSGTYSSGYYYWTPKPETPWFGLGVKHIVVSDGITVIGTRAFSTLTGVISVSLPDTLTTIYLEAFERCTNLEQVTLPASLTFIDNFAFEECRNLKSITFLGDAPNIAATTFNDVASNVYYTPYPSWTGKTLGYGGSLTWIKPSGDCGTDSGWVLTDISTLRINGTGNISEATWTKYADSVTTFVISSGVNGLDSSLLDSLPNLNSIIFEGNPPALATGAFAGVSATVYYPHNSDAWTEDIRLNYGGSPDWQPYCTYSDSAFSVPDAIYCEEAAPSGCATDGYHSHWKCSDCGLAFTGEDLTQRMTDEDLIIPAPGHSLILFEGTPATCTETGLTDGIFCEVCGEILQEQVEIPLAEHTDIITIEAIAPTCISVGYTAEHRCEVCGAILDEVKEIPFGDHTDSISVEAIEPTCTTVGYTAEHRCAVCGILLEEREEIPTVPHTDSISAEAVEPTCSSFGYTEEHRCAVCGEVLIAAEEIAKLPHTDIITIEYLAPTCTAEGHSEEHTCSVCGETITASETIPPTGHTYSDPATEWSGDGHTCIFTFECIHDDDIQAIVTEAAGTESIAPACLETGTTLYTATVELNGKTYTDTTTREDIPATGHTPEEDAAVAPTDRETGLTAGSHCSVCGTVLTARETIPALWSYTEDGLTAITYNGTETELTIPAGVTALSDTLFKGNTAVTCVHIPAEVTTLGTQTFFGATGMTDIWLPADLDGIGMQTFYNTTAVLHTPADGQTAKAISLRNKNFTDGNYTLRYKITSLTSEPTAAYLISWQGDETELSLPESFGGAPLTQIQTGAFADRTQLLCVTIPDSVTTIAADAFTGCSEDLVIRSSWNAYAKTWAESSNIAWEHYPHTIVTEAAAAPTCTEPGMTEGRYCTECGKILAVQEIIPALGHDWSEPAYEWSEDLSRVTATRVCAHDASHTETETAGVQRVLTAAPTETEPGSFSLVSDAFGNEAFNSQEREDGAIPALQDMNVLRLPASLTVIETGAFDGINAEAVIIPEGCAMIEAEAFANCANLIYIRVPTGTEIADGAFAGCPNAMIDRQ